MSKKTLVIIPSERVESKIYFIRGKKIMFDKDLSELYGVATKVLNQAVRRNLKRFPEDFMFRLNKQELEIWKSQIVTSNDKNLRSQIVTSSLEHGGLRYPPYVFTEQGIAMLSSVLNSERAIQVNIQIMRTFTKIREMLVSNKVLRDKIEKLENKYDSQFKVVFDAIKRLIATDSKPLSQIGFRTGK
jgi:hypothetical protein